MKSLRTRNWDNNDPVIPFASVSHEPADTGVLDAPNEAPNLDAMGQLAAGIAHHFNNLLTPIHANSQLLLELSDLPPDSRNLVEQNLIASRRVAHLIRQLAGFSEHQYLNVQPLDLNRAVEATVGDVPSATGRGIEVDRQYGPELPRVLADRVSLDQVIRHLLLNAADSMPAGGRLTLSTERIFMKPSMARAGSEQFVCLAVSDTGCGIPLEHMGRICEPFFTTKATPDHSGLGLTFVYGIIKQHRGWTEVTSKLGQGTTFKICLPAAPPPPAIDLAEWSEQSTRATRRLPEWEAEASVRLNDALAAEWDFMQPAGIWSEPFLHGGINE